ncbi:MAG: PEP-CTERM sorting domain-containing protein [Ketobacter sp.]|nr:PEP-CTERM sorting domain-containing protein [Ketobacter sp.]
MRIGKQGLVVAAALALAAQAVQAVPVNYVFSGHSIGEYTDNNTWISAGTIFSGSTALSGSFTYENEATEVGSVPVPGYNNASFTAYQDAFSDIDMVVGGSSVTADSGYGLVGNNVSPTGVPALLDVLLGYSSGSNPATNLSSLTIGDWSLTGFSFVFVNGYNSFVEDDLPLGAPGSSNLMEFMFSNSDGIGRKIRYQLDSIEAASVPVPEPASVFLTALGIAGIWVRKRSAK